MRPLLALIVSVLVGLFISAGDPLAQTVVVRSGEHRDFSRLVLEFAHLNGWELRRRNDEYDLRVMADNQPVDISRVFRFIPKSRLMAISQDTGSAGLIRMTISRDHRVAATEMSPGKLVVDIRRGPAGAANGLVASGGDPVPLRPRQPPVPLTGGRERYVADAAIRNPRANRTRADIPPELSKRKVVVIPAPMPDFRVLKAQEQLIDSLDKALEQGIVIPADQHSSHRMIVPQIRFADDPKAAGEGAESLSPGPDARETEVSENSYFDHLNVRSATVFDRQQERAPQAAAGRSVDGSPCLDDQQLDLSDWVGDAPVHRQISQLRLRLMDDVDRVNLPVLQQLVRLYVVMGFGTEARALMRSVHTRLPDESLLTDLSILIENGALDDRNGAPEDSRVLASQSGCKGAAGMWALLAMSGVPLGQTPDRNMINGYFSNLSGDLRRRIGPVLGEILLSAGFEEEAHSVARIIVRASGDDGPASKLFNARLDLKSNKRPHARLALAGLIDGNRPNAPVALMVLARDYLAQGEPVPNAIEVEIGARAFELRHSKLGQELKALEIEILTTRGDQESALDNLSHEILVGTLEPSGIRNLTNQVFLSFRSADAGSVAFVPVYYKYRSLLGRDPGFDTARRHVAELLLKASLPDAALSTLIPVAGRMTDDTRLLYAGAFLQSDRPSEALSILSRVRGDAARQVRMSALSRLKEYDQAESIALSANESALRDDVFWLAGREAEVTKSKIPSRHIFAPYMRARPTERAIPGPFPHEPVITDPGISLARVRALLEQSRTARAETEELKTQHPFP